MVIREFVAQGATTDEAIENGCRELGISRDDASFEIVELPRQKTMFGLFGGSPAIVRVYVEGPDPIEEPEAEEPFEAAAEQYEVETNGEQPEGEQAVPSKEQGEKAAEYLRGIIAAMGLTDVNVELIPNEDGSGATLDITGDGLGAIIGRRGETLSALQYLVSLAANKRGSAYYRVAINIGSYREKREDSLENLAKKTALRSIKIQRNLALDPMNPYERRIIHTTVQEIEGASSWSVGEDSKRHVVIGPTGVDEGAEGLPVNHGRGGNRGGRGGYGGGRGSYGGNRGGYSRRSYGNSEGGYSRRSYGNSEGGYSRRSYGNSEGGYSRRSYGNSEGGYSRRSYGNSEGGYSRRSYGDSEGGYNRGGRSYGRNDRSESTQSYSAPREAKKDTSAPLYGRIEVPKRSDDNE